MLKPIHYCLLSLSLALPLAACSGEDGQSGSSGSDGTDGKDGKDGKDGDDKPSTPEPTPEPARSVNSVSPSSALIDRRVEIQVAGSNTSWDESTQVDFGAGVTVHDIRVASPTSLFVTIESSVDVDREPRDIRVITGSETLVFKQGFSFSPTLKFVSSWLGRAAQGSLLATLHVSLDPSNPLPSVWIGEDPHTNPLVQLEIHAPPGIQADAMVVSNTEIAMQLLIAGNAPVGSVPVHLTATVGGETFSLFDPLGLEIEERAPTPLTATETPLEFAHESDVLYLQLDAAEDLTIAEVAVADEDNYFDIIPLRSDSSFYILPDGYLPYHYDYGTVLNKSESLLFVASNLEAGSVSPSLAYTSLLRRYLVKASSFNHTTPNDTSADATPLTLPAVVANGEFSAEEDVDYYHFNVDESAVGKQLIIRSYGEDESSIAPSLERPMGVVTSVKHAGYEIREAGDHYIYIEMHNRATEGATFPYNYRFYAYLRD